MANQGLNGGREPLLLWERKRCSRAWPTFLLWWKWNTSLHLEGMLLTFTTPASWMYSENLPQIRQIFPSSVSCAITCGIFTMMSTSFMLRSSHPESLTTMYSMPLEGSQWTTTRPTSQKKCCILCLCHPCILGTTWVIPIQGLFHSTFRWGPAFLEHLSGALTCVNLLILQHCRESYLCLRNLTGLGTSIVLMCRDSITWTSEQTIVKQWNPRSSSGVKTSEKSEYLWRKPHEIPLILKVWNTRLYAKQTVTRPVSPTLRPEGVCCSKKTKLASLFFFLNTPW